MRRTFRFSISVLVAPLAFSIHAQTTVHDHEVLSKGSPSVTIRVEPSFTYLGRLPFSFGEYEGERIIFGEVAKKRLSRLLIVQFEHFVPSSHEIYRYDMDRAEPVGPLRFRQNAFAFSPSQSISSSPRDEGGRTTNFLLDRGFKLPALWLVSRYVTLGGEDRKSEMIVFYMEAEDRMDLHDLYAGDDPTPAWRQLSPQVDARARKAFSIE